jgi:hypothetical protein
MLVADLRRAVFLADQGAIFADSALLCRAITRLLDDETELERLRPAPNAATPTEPKEASDHE